MVSWDQIIIFQDVHLILLAYLISPVTISWNHWYWWSKLRGSMFWRISMEWHFPSFIRKFIIRKMSSMICSNFDFLNNPWWHSDFDDRDIKYFIYSISSTKIPTRNISSAIGNGDDLLWKGYIDYHRERYIVECISAEYNIDLIVNYVQQLLKPSWFQIFSSYIYRIFFKRHSYNAHFAKKVQNLYGAITDIFPSIFFPNLLEDRLLAYTTITQPDR